MHSLYPWKTISIWKGEILLFPKIVWIHECNHKWFCILKKGTKRTSGRIKGNPGYSHMDTFTVPMENYIFLERWDSTLSKNVYFYVPSFQQDLNTYAINLRTFRSSIVSFWSNWTSDWAHLIDFQCSTLFPNTESNV